VVWTKAIVAENRAHRRRGFHGANQSCFVFGLVVMPHRYFTTLDVNGRVVWHSSSSTVSRPSEMIGTYAWDWCASHDVDQCKRAISHAIVIGEPTGVVLRCTGNPTPYAVRYTPLLRPAVLVVEAMPDSRPQLTDREETVLSAICNDESPSALAARMKISISTVESFRAALKRKLAADGTAGLVLAAVRYGFIQPVLLAVLHFDCAAFGNQWR
jgi:DNA-binding CsgD family transcriptional regulator